MNKQLKRWANATRMNAMLKDDGGAALVEYGLLVGLIAVVCILAVTALGAQIHNVFCTIVTDIGTAIPALAAAQCPQLAVVGG
jgi:pilus assembly protein Flp/PilA